MLWGRGNAAPGASTVGRHGSNAHPFSARASIFSEVHNSMPVAVCRWHIISPRGRLAGLRPTLFLTPNITGLAILIWPRSTHCLSAMHSRVRTRGEPPTRFSLRISMQSIFSRRCSCTPGPFGYSSASSVRVCFWPIRLNRFLVSGTKTKVSGSKRFSHPSCDPARPTGRALGGFFSRPPSFQHSVDRAL